MKLHLSEPKIPYPYMESKNFWQSLDITVKNCSQEDISIVAIYALRQTDSARHLSLSFQFLWDPKFCRVLIKLNNQVNSLPVIGLSLDFLLF